MKPYQVDHTKALLAAIVDSSDDAIVSKTLDGVITSWNRGAEKMFGYSASEAIGQPITLIIPVERHGEEAEVLARIGRGEKVDHFETIRQSKDGRRLNISLTVSPIRDSEGRVVGASKVARDITEQKLAADRLERLAEWEQAARKSAEEASRLKDDFLATVSHELRNPLNSIMGWAELLSSGKLDDQARGRAVAAIRRGAQGQDQIINDLLDISRIITGRLRLDTEPLQLSEVLEAAIDTVRPAADAKQISVQALLDPLAGPMVADPNRLRQIFWNLLSNAVKFTPKGGRVQIFSRRVESNLEVVIRDTGIGIEPELLPFVFDRFRQGDSGSNRRNTGLGLGLAIARNLVELHGGMIRADSKGSGQGATFTVTLPTLIASLPPEKEATNKNAEGIMPAEDVPSLVDLKILVVDDDPAARELLFAILNQAQAKVRTAESAQEALEMMDAWPPDVLVSDIGMPRVDGYELIHLVRARGPDNGGDVPAAALTAYARTQDRLRALSAGFQMHIPKPIEPAELIMVIASLRNRALVPISPSLKH